MALVQTIDNAYVLRSIFVDYERDYYSLDGYQFIVDYFDDYDEELDTIGIACTFTEYGTICGFEFTGMLSAYFGITDGDDGLAYCTIGDDEFYTDDLSDWECSDSLIVDAAFEELNNQGYIAYRLDNGDIMIIE